MQLSKKIILGSNSPRRRELLAGLDIDFQVDTKNNFEERFEPGTDPHEVPVILAHGKSMGFHRPLESDEVLITADTIVISKDGQVIGKPHSREDAISMLQTLSGCRHEVVTAVVVRDTESLISFSDSTFVYFDEIPDEDIIHYVDTYKPFDKAGSYGIQEWIGYMGIGRIEGSFYNVMGFPVNKVYKALSKYICR